MKYYAKIIGTGQSLPPNKYTTSDLKQFFPSIDVNDIINKIGVQTRYFTRNFETNTISHTNSELTCLAAYKALNNAKLEPEDIDLIITTTASPDYSIPNLACVIQKLLNIKNAAGLGLLAGCGGFTNALTVASQFIENGNAKNVLVTGSETLSPYLDFNHKKCVAEQSVNATIFGDAAGAVILSRSTSPGIISNFFKIDGHRNPLYLHDSGSKQRPNSQTLEQGLHFWDLNFRLIVGLTNKLMEEAVFKTLRKAKMNLSDINWIIPHQPTLPLVHKFAKKINFPIENMFYDLQIIGDTANACLPITLDNALKHNKIKKGDIIMLVAAGAGWTYGANIIKW